MFFSSRFSGFSFPFAEFLRKTFLFSVFYKQVSTFRFSAKSLQVQKWTFPRNVIPFLIRFLRKTFQVSVFDKQIFTLRFSAKSLQVQKWTFPRNVILFLIRFPLKCFSSFYFSKFSFFWEISENIHLIFWFLNVHLSAEFFLSAQLTTNVSRLQEVAMNQDQAFTNINKTFN